MAVTHVQDQHAPNGTFATFPCTITSTVNNTLVAFITMWNNGTSPINIQNLQDSAGNKWVYSTAPVSQYPPTNGSYDSAHGQYGFSAIAYCVNAKAVTSVTLTMNTSVTFGEFGVSEFAGLPAGATLLAANSTGNLVTAVTSYTTPSIVNPVASLAVANTSFFADFSGVTAGWNLVGFSDTLGAYNLAAPAGNVAPVFTSGSSNNIPSSAILSLGISPWQNAYTYNFCSNPSFEVDLTGVQSFNGGVTGISQAGLYGAQCLSVSTPGQNPSEGVILPPGTVVAPSTGSVSFFLQGASPTASGTLTVYAIDTTSSTTLGSTTLSFDNTTGWTRYSISDLTFASAHNIAVYIETIGVQQASFLVDGIQYEPSLPVNLGNIPTPYVDGDQTFGVWVGTQQESASYKLYQNQISAGGGIRTFGYGSLLQQGAAFHIVFSDPASGPTQVKGNIDLSGKSFKGLTGILAGGGTVVTTGITVGLMFAGMNDFAVFSPGDIDPAISLIGYNNTAISSGTNTSGSAGYTRPYATFSAPQAFTGSGTKNIWNTAAYFAVGYSFASIANNVAQNITHSQVELIPGNGTAPVPSSYTRPRALTATLAPTRLNYVPNPSFEVSTAQWTVLNGTLTRVAGGALTGSSWSGQAVTTFTNSGIYIPVPFLIVGEEYTASVYVKPTTSVGNITFIVGSAQTVITPVINTWQRISLTFVATQSNPTLTVFSAVAGTFLVDAVMLEVGGALNAYADGSFLGWNWEVAANAGLTRSYWYERGNIAYAAVQSILSDHLPLGLHAYSPVFNSPPTQYSA